MIAFALLCILPVLWIFLSGFKSTAEFNQVPPTLLPETFDFSKLLTVWKKTDLGMSFVATIYMVAGDLAFTLIVNGLGGYVLSRLKPKGTGIVLMLILWTMMLPTSINMVPLFISFMDFTPLHLNLIDTFFPMWFMSGANAFNLMLFKSFFDSIPLSYVEAARIDGCSDGGIFMKIILPLSKPIMMTVAIFTFSGSWGAFLWPYLVIQSKTLMTIGVKLYNLKSITSIDEYMLSLAFVLIPPTIVFMLFQKHIMQGFSVGGIKG